MQTTIAWKTVGRAQATTKDYSTIVIIVIIIMVSLKIIAKFHSRIMNKTKLTRIRITIIHKNGSEIFKQYVSEKITGTSI